MSVIREVLKKLLSGPLTEDFPRKSSPTPENYRGVHELDTDLCLYIRYGICGSCEWVCPSNAICHLEEGGRRVFRLDLGKCIFCSTCMEICPTKSIKLTRNYEFSRRSRGEIVLEWR